MNYRMLVYSVASSPRAISNRLKLSKYDSRASVMTTQMKHTGHLLFPRPNAFLSTVRTFAQKNFIIVLIMVDSDPRGEKPQVRSLNCRPPILDLWSLFTTKPAREISSFLYAFFCPKLQCTISKGGRLFSLQHHSVAPHPSSRGPFPSQVPGLCRDQLCAPLAAASRS